MHDYSDFQEIWLVDFEFSASPGERPTPLCLVAREFRSGQLIRQWLKNDGTDLPPFSLSVDSLYVAYFASAELGCHLALGWTSPMRILDLYVEFRNLTNGQRLPCGNGLLGALIYFGLQGIDQVEKSSMRDLAMRGGLYTEQEKLALLDYCQSDVDSLFLLFQKMSSLIDIQRAVIRGRYMNAVAQMECQGIPVESDRLAAMKTHWTRIQDSLVHEIDQSYEIYEGRTFKTDRFQAYLQRQQIPWPRLPSGKLALDDETFRMMSRKFPVEIGPIHELRSTLGQLRLNDLSVGKDGRNRCLLSPFRSKTGRNQPSNSKFIFGPSAWIRSLIKPQPGSAIAYVDWSQQEFGIAAALSGDANMQEAYTSGDPYLAFAKQAKAVPNDATKKSHPREREQFKVCALAVQYGMGPESLAESLGEIPSIGRELLRLHQQTYPDYWKWSQAAVDQVMLNGVIQTVFGWKLHSDREVNPRSLANFPCQANGAEMLRLACCLAVEGRISICAPIHDALLIEAPLPQIEFMVSETQSVMQKASEIILNGFSLRTDVEIVRWPDRYRDVRGATMWTKVNQILGSLSPEGVGVGC